MSDVTYGTSRTIAIGAALKRELDQRREYLDAAADIGEVTITLRLQPGTTWVKRVTWQEERLCRNRP